MLHSTTKNGFEKCSVAILGDVEPWLPARRKKRNLAKPLLNMGVLRVWDDFSGGRMPPLYGRPGGLPLLFKQALTCLAFRRHLFQLIGQTVSSNEVFQLLYPPSYDECFHGGKPVITPRTFITRLD